MRTCYECCCTETSDNPIIEIEDDHGSVIEAMCLECYTERLWEQSEID
jgi:hypothetical protein